MIQQQQVHRLNDTLNPSDTITNTLTIAININDSTTTYQAVNPTQLFGAD